MAYSVKLPRPRALLQRAVNDKIKRNLLDDMLLPLLDETVRRSYFIREADNRGDTVEADRLRGEMSERQKIKELSRQALRDGNAIKAEALDDMAIQLGTVHQYFLLQDSTFIVEYSFI